VKVEARTEEEAEEEEDVAVEGAATLDPPPPPAVALGEGKVPTSVTAEVSTNPAVALKVAPTTATSSSRHGRRAAVVEDVVGEEVAVEAAEVAEEDAAAMVAGSMVAGSTAMDRASTLPALVAGATAAVTLMVGAAAMKVVAVPVPVEVLAM